jgi:hypothetical protein
MTIFGQINSGTSDPERLVGILAILGLLCLAVWKGVKWLLEARPASDPWDETVAAEVEKDKAIPLCHHCLTPHNTFVDFCPSCGTPVGQYTNWLPFPQLFSIGHVLRTGTSGDYKRSPLTIVGFMLFALAQYTLFVPIYWIMFLRKLLYPRPPDNPPGQAHHH